jgi:hypothetical protein
VDVADRGPGLSEAQCVSIFRPYEHSASSQVRCPAIVVSFRMHVSRTGNIPRPRRCCIGRRRRHRTVPQPGVCARHGRRPDCGQHAGRGRHVRAHPVMELVTRVASCSFSRA